MAPYPPGVELAQQTNHSQTEIGRWGSDFHTGRGGINPDDIRVCPRVVGVVDVCVDGFRSRHVTLSCPGDAYFVYEPRPMSDQTKMTCFFFRLIKLESEILSCQHRKRCNRVLYLQEVSDL